MNSEAWFFLVQFVSTIASALAGYGVMAWYLSRNERRNGKR